MPAETVLDASFVGAMLFNEPQALRAQAALGGGLLSAPDLLLVELTSVGAKKRRRGEPCELSGVEIMQQARLFLDRLDPVEDHLPAAFDIAATTRVSVYDALYLALARARGAAVLTFDVRFGRAAREAGFGAYVEVIDG